MSVHCAYYRDCLQYVYGYMQITPTVRARLYEPRLYADLGFTRFLGQNLVHPKVQIVHIHTSILCGPRLTRVLRPKSGTPNYHVLYNRDLTV